MNLSPTHEQVEPDKDQQRLRVLSGIVIAFFLMAGNFLLLSGVKLDWFHDEVININADFGIELAVQV